MYRRLTNASEHIHAGNSPSGLTLDLAYKKIGRPVNDISCNRPDPDAPLAANKTQESNDITPNTPESEPSHPVLFVCVSCGPWPVLVSYVADGCWLREKMGIDIYIYIHIYIDEKGRQE